MHYVMHIFKLFDFEKGVDIYIHTYVILDKMN